MQDIVGVDLFNAEIYFFTRIPAQVYPSDVVTVVAMALRPVVPGDALPVLARGAARSGGGAAL